MPCLGLPSDSKARSVARLPVKRERGLRGFATRERSTDAYWLITEVTDKVHYTVQHSGSSSRKEATGAQDGLSRMGSFSTSEGGS